MPNTQTLSPPMEYITRCLEDQSSRDGNCPGNGPQQPGCSPASQEGSQPHSTIPPAPHVLLSSEETRTWDLGTLVGRLPRLLPPGCSQASLTRSRAHPELKEELDLQPRSAHFLSILKVTFKKKNYKNNNGHCGKRGN